jgi:hypothetical protein
LFKKDSLKLSDYAKELETHLKGLEVSKGLQHYSIEKMSRERLQECQEYISVLKGERFLMLSSLLRKVSRDKLIKLLCEEEKKKSFIYCA